MRQETIASPRQKIHDVEVLAIRDQGSTFDITLRGTTTENKTPHEVTVTDGHHRLVLTLAIAKMMKCRLTSVTTEEIEPGKRELKCVLA